MQFLNLSLTLLLTVFMSCSNDDNSAENETLSGVWHLKNVSGGIQGTNIDYEEGEVKWAFRESDNAVVVENNIMTTGPEDIFAGLDSGVYEYEIQQLGQTKMLYVDGNVMGAILFSSGNLKIDEGSDVDGLVKEFTR